jgi:hypothetical protein
MAWPVNFMMNSIASKRTSRYGDAAGMRRPRQHLEMYWQCMRISITNHWKSSLLPGPATF